jgi:hypothetical protein
MDDATGFCTGPGRASDRGKEGNMISIINYQGSSEFAPRSQEPPFCKQSSWDERQPWENCQRSLTKYTYRSDPRADPI